MSLGCTGTHVATRPGVGNKLAPVTGTIEFTALVAVSGTIEVRRASGPRFPRPHLQLLETEARTKRS